MTEIKIEQSKDGTYRGFHVIGHSGYAEEGSDIICASISMLVINTINAITEFTSDAIVCTSEEKTASIRVQFPQAPSHDTDLLVKTMVLGLDQIQQDESYQPYIQMIFEEV
jgi:hypothetical protein